MTTLLRLLRVRWAARANGGPCRRYSSQEGARCAGWQGFLFSDAKALHGVFILLAVVFAGHALADNVSLSARRLEDARLVRILASADVRRLPGDAHTIRLYDISQEGTCVSGTHWVCSHDYYLAISTIDTSPEQAVYHLGTVGEITSVVSLAPLPGAQARFLLTTANYPAAVLSAVPSLERVARRFELRIFEGQLDVEARGE